MEKLEILWGIFGGIGTASLGLIAFGLKKMVSTTIENTIAIKILNEKMTTIVEKLDKIPKLEKDLSAAHDKLRNLNGGSK